ncbi:MAG: 5-(carboxyamino)imidazole ribonucleotide synthase [Acidimicrobiales bacterium]
MASSETLAPGATIGIIGGGQLGRMLAMAAARLGYHTVVLDPAPTSPAAQVANDQITAPYDDFGALEALAHRCDVVTYEFENVPVDGVAHLDGQVPVCPAPLALEIAQDRLVEKDFLNEIGIPTAPYATVDSQADVATAVSAVGGRAILKTRRLGYDGKGQLRVSSVESIAPDTFAKLGSVPAIAEGFIDFDAEVSVICARGVDGRCEVFDPARNVHRDGILATSTVPAGLPPAILDAARNAAASLAEALDYVGVLGIELFVLADGSILANEFAPRVHNSGHWTEAVCVPDQFEQHIRAIVGAPLSAPVRRADCEMTNLIGDDIASTADLLAEPGAMIHLYGKAEARPGRKMGHITRITC